MKVLFELKEAIIVEGKYDKARLSGIVDALIVETNGFRIFKDKKKLDVIRRLAKTTGIIVFTDNDAAGFIIRNYIKSSVQQGMIKHAYTPNVFGKEKRKDKPSKEGKLGVEGMTDKSILESLTRANFEINDKKQERKITKQDLYEYGFIGQNNSKLKRETLMKKLDLPEYISTNEFINLLNCFWSYDEFIKNVSKEYKKPII